jgi:nicotinamide-nucleotide amidase
MNAIVVNIGNELLNGHTLNKNGYAIAKELTSQGVEVLEIVSIQDSKIALHNVLNRVEQTADFCVITGGLGPTQDDQTRFDFADFFGLECHYTESCFSHIINVMGERGREFSKENKVQCYVPEGATTLKNPLGTALGIYYASSKVKYFLTPGVPSEMNFILNDSILPTLSQEKKWIKAEWYTYGLGESKLTHILGEWQPPQGITFASLPSEKFLLVRISTHTLSVLDKAWQEAKLFLDNALPKDFLLPEAGVIHSLGKQLQNENAFLGTAESCTGGLVGSLITGLSGSSNWFKGSIVSYANDVKINALGVKLASLEKFGAVSEEVATEMVEGSARELKVEAAVSLTGVAGPNGGSIDKPVGLVCIGIYWKGKSCSLQKLFRGNREEVRLRSTYYALNELRKFIQKSTCTSEQ